MIQDNQELGQAEANRGNPVDFTFLDTQTFGDAELKREILALFLAQADRVVPTLPALPPREQGDAAHLIKGSARGIGAWEVATLAQRFEDADISARPAAFVVLAAALDGARDAIRAYLGATPA